VFRNILFITLLSVSLFGDYAKERKVASEVGLISILTHKEIADKNKRNIGESYLSIMNKDLWRKYAKNEFEIGSLSLKYYDKLIEDAKKAKSKYMNKELTFTFKTKFGKYNFEKEGFPVKFPNIGKKPAFDIYNGGGNNFHSNPVFVAAVDLVLEKFNPNNVLLKMNKKQAKEFLKNGRDRNRELTAVISGIVRDVRNCNTIGWKEVKYEDPTYETTFRNQSGLSPCIILEYKTLRFTD